MSRRRNDRRRMIESVLEIADLLGQIVEVKRSHVDLGAAEKVLEVVAPTLERVFQSFKGVLSAERHIVLVNGRLKQDVRRRGTYLPCRCCLAERMLHASVGSKRLTQRKARRRKPHGSTGWHLHYS